MIMSLYYISSRNISNFVFPRLTGRELKKCLVIEMCPTKVSASSSGSPGNEKKPLLRFKPF